MSRSPNSRGPSKPGVALAFAPHELRMLRLNTPGPSGQLGGYQKLENYILQSVNQQTGQCQLDAKHLERLIRYIRKYGGGGPNGRLRNACIPPLRRAGIDLQPEWRA